MSTNINLCRTSLQSYNPAHRSLSANRIVLILTSLLSLIILTCSLILSSKVHANTAINPSPAPKKIMASHKTIGISQIIEHSALDIVRQSMIDTLKQEGFIQGKNLTIYYENAHGNMVTATQIANQLLSKDLDVAVGISTPSTQALLQPAQKLGKNVPIVFTAVTDPKSAKLTPDTTNYPITGVTDVPNLEGLWEVLHTLMPNLKTLGVLYNPAEANSVSTLLQLKQRLKERGVTIIEASVNSTADVPQATKSLLGKIDALYFPQDNTVVAAMQSVITIANQSSPVLPIILPISSNDPNILKGILAANGYDYKDVGHETGLMIARVLKGEPTSNIPIHSPAISKTIINETLVKKLGLVLPKTLANSKIEIVHPN